MPSKPTQDVISNGTYKTHSRYNGCVGHWIMLEGGGLTTVDITGNNNTGTLVSGPTWGTGQFAGPAIGFDGLTGDYVNCQSATILDDIVNMTVSAWIYPRTMGQSLANSYRGAVVCKGRTSSGWNWSLSSSGGATVGCKFANALNTTNMIHQTSDGTIALNTWQHVVATYIRAANTPATNARVFINGTEPSYVISQNGSGSVTGDSALELLIGNNVTSAFDQTFDGFIDEVRIYTRILSDSEISSLYTDPFLEFGGIPIGAGPFGRARRGLGR